MKNYLKAFLAVGAFLFASVGLADTTGEINSETFEGLTAGESLNVKTAATDGSIFWDSGDADDEGSMGEFAVVTAYETESESGGKNYLALETTNPLYRHVQGGGTAQDIDTGLYFEGDVQFSPYEEDVDTSEYKENGTKLLVYIKGTETTTDDNENEVKGTTNFVIVAGYYNNDNDVAEIKNYVCEAPSDFDYNKDTWHHLLLKAYLTTDGSCSYFKVFVDDTALTCTEEKGSSESSMANIGAEGFPSMTKGSATTLKDVGFKGTGKVDNLVWTTVDPKPTTLTYVFTWDSVQGDPVVKIGDDKQDIEAGEEYTYTEAQVKTMTLAFDTNDWYVNGIYSSETVDNVTTVKFTATKAAVSMQIGEASVEYYETLDDVISYLSKNAQEESTTVSIVLGADVNLSGNYSFYDDAPTTIIDLNGQNITLGTLEGCTLTINNSQSKYGYVTGKVSADILYINGGAFSEEPLADTLNTGDKKLATTTIDGTTWYVLVDDGGSTEPTIDGGDSGATTVDPETKTITVDSSASGEITITGDASEYTISVPQNVTKITGSVGTITIMGKSESMTTAVDITGAFKLDSTTTDGVTTIALDPDGKVTVNGVEVSVTPELDTTTEGTEPFAVGDSVSATVKAIPGLTYQLLGATDLTTKTTKEWAGVGEAVTATDSGTVTLEDTNTEKPDAKFYVIKVSR